ncbi:MAG TPA: glycerate kinase, partial [Candidatus Baltobacteraceae bacterium]
LDADGRELEPGGGALQSIARIDSAQLDPRLAHTFIEVAADVDNPLCGPTGASAIFGPQKGASPADVTFLDAALTRFADVTTATLGVDPRNAAGAGAAGGLGFALVAFLNATLRPGVEIIAELRGLREALENADLCITGEGRIDEQTLRGKTVAGVARLAHAAHVPLIAVAGTVTAQGEAALMRQGVTVLPIADGPLTLEEAIAGAAPLLERTGARLARLLAL